MPIDKQHPHSVRIHNPQNTAVVQFLSKAWNESQRNQPPFYLEADALLWSTDKCKFYALSSPFPLYTHSDHLPLQWMNASTKGPASQFLIENLSEIETVPVHHWTDQFHRRRRQPLSDAWTSPPGPSWPYVQHRAAAPSTSCMFEKFCRRPHPRRLRHPESPHCSAVVVHCNRRCHADCPRPPWRPACC